MDAKIFSTGETNPQYIPVFHLFIFSFGNFYAIIDQVLELGESFFDLGDRTGAINKFSLRWVKLLRIRKTHHHVGSMKICAPVGMK
jgi:hypothetical protein